jgi:cytochrome P450
VPGVWGNTLSFLGGPHACIGYKFSLYETKLILHALLAAFEMELAVPAAEIGEKRGIVTRPAVKGAREDGAQMPVVLRRVAAE